MNISDKRLKWLFYTVWTLLLVLQAIFTELNPDEAYYWKYAQKLDWGYFDHPPMIALMIKIGYFMLKGQLGVRLLPILFSVLTIMAWEKLIQPKNLKVFYGLVVSVGILHFIGFMAVPDAPLLLSASLFFLCYRQFLEKADWKSAVVLAFTISLMLYSKYHGILVVAFTVLSNLNLIRSKFFWITAVISILFLSPHIMWQINSDFPSVMYHLFWRSPYPFNPKDLIEYIITQPFVLGPVTGILFLIAASRIKAEDSFERSLKYTFWGVYLLFALSTFKGRPEAHWTLVAVIPALYFGYKMMIQSDRMLNILKIQLPVVIILILMARAILAFDVLPESKLTSQFRKQFHNKKKWAMDIRQTTKDLPVAFMNSYQKASLYEFYTGVPSFSLNNIEGRKNQFDIWQSEDLFRGQTVFLMYKSELLHEQEIDTNAQVIENTVIENFQSFSKIKITALEIPKKARVGESIKVKIKVECDNPEEVDFGSNKNYPVSLSASFFHIRHLVKLDNLVPAQNNMLNQEIEIELTMPDQPNKYGCFLSFRTGWLSPTYNSRKYVIDVVED